MSKSLVLIVGENNHLTAPLAQSLREKGVDSLCVPDGAKAATIIDVAEQEGSPIELAFLSSELRQAQLEWLLTYIRAKEAFRISRVIVLSAENESKIKYWLSLGATSCVGTTAHELEQTASYWADLMRTG